MKMFRYFFVLFLIFSSGVASTLKIGVIPTMDPLKVVTMYQPLKQYLETELKEKVEIYTSNSYEKFYADSERGEFDIAITAPHFGVLHLENGFTPILKYSAKLEPIFVVLQSSPIKTAKDLKNKKIALSNYLSASSIGGLKVLIDAKMKNNIDFKLLNSKSHISAIISVVKGDADAAITTTTPWIQITDEAIKSKVRYFESGFIMPHIFTIAHPSIDKNRVKAIKKALLKFKTSATGKEFFKDTGFEGYKDISKKDINAMKPVLNETKIYLGLK